MVFYYFSISLLLFCIFFFFTPSDYPNNCFFFQYRHTTTVADRAHYYRFYIYNTVFSIHIYALYTLFFGLLSSLPIESTTNPRLVIVFILSAASWCSHKLNQLTSSLSWTTHPIPLPSNCYYSRFSRLYYTPNTRYLLLYSSFVFIFTPRRRNWYTLAQNVIFNHII
jgi:hypothetical protein